MTKETRRPIRGSRERPSKWLVPWFGYQRGRVLPHNESRNQSEYKGRTHEDARCMVPDALNENSVNMYRLDMITIPALFKEDDTYWLIPNPLVNFSEPARFQLHFEKVNSSLDSRLRESVRFRLHFENIGLNFRCNLRESFWLQHQTERVGFGSDFNFERVGWAPTPS